MVTDEKQLPRTIAIDFDGTLFVEQWPDIGAPIWPVINEAKKEKANGSLLILWTTREREDLQAALSACKKVGLEFDAINDNCKEWIEAWGQNTRKIGCTEFWDDRSINTRDIVKTATT